LALDVLGRGGVPSLGVKAVFLNVTVDGATDGSFLSVYPSGSPRPDASNLNFGANQTRPNLVGVPVGPDGRVVFYNDQGSVDVIVDVSGYVGDSTIDAGLFRPVNPVRALDTRLGYGGGYCQPVSCPTLTPATTMRARVAGRGDVPRAGVAAVAINVTATNTSAASFLTVFPADRPAPNSSSLNWLAGQTVANRVIVPVAADGTVSLYNNQGTADIVIDVTGWFTAPYAGSGALPAGSLFFPVIPARVADTRPNIPGSPNASPYSNQPLGTGGALRVLIAGADPVPVNRDQQKITAALLNLTVISPTEGTFLTVTPRLATTGATTSDLNAPPGDIRSNAVLAPLAPDGSVMVFNGRGTTDFLLDVMGYFACARRCP
jgi:hypothetical protein